MLLCPATGSRAADPAGNYRGVWLIPLKAAVQIFVCADLLCGRIVWLRHARDSSSQPVRDLKNPDPVLRTRALCGLTVLWGLQPAGAGHWKAGWFYNPEDGKTYRVNADARSADVIVARIYVGLPLFGETWIFDRVPHLNSEGWC